MSNKSNALRLKCEQLEDRSNPDGSVAAFVSNGTLFIIGDGFNNAVSLQQNQFGDVFLVGMNNTSVNGFSSIYLGTGTPGALWVDLGAGDDYIEVLGLSTYAGWSILGNTGNDTLAVVGASAPSIDIYGMDGNDNTYMSGVTAARVILDGGTGIDAVHVDNVFAPLYIFNSEIPY